MGTNTDTDTDTSLGPYTHGQYNTNQHTDRRRHRPWYPAHPRCKKADQHTGPATGKGMGPSVPVVGATLRMTCWH
eukprot:1139515-Pelagomonas_calceolata.AAC.4